ncbi:SDR family oxidoreductase [Paenibacillus sp. LHD-117]|uniref:SDR family oxidoreductase n=1 Tax=Paenibacillus sp. LHD-117 TaxID=3071412 RepID=UPI0027E0F492|nr:SDR family oxidoreductase [Paenibacillus sp. LHD-117]MDQ6420395.1 SDR family oxidoreductase [Paenibacillus sp. LHD-117]
MRNVLITGANRGLGYELAAEAAARGYQVWAGVRGPGSPAGKLHALVERYADLVHVLPLDVTDENSVKYAFEQMASRIDSLDVVINSAAILLGRDQKLEELELEQVEQSFQTNLFGPLLVMKHAIPLLGKGHDQAIINISSEAGSMAGAYGGDYSYAISKSALNMFTAQLRSQYAPLGYAVYAVHPGWIRTDMGGEAAPGDASESAAGIMDLVDRKRGDLEGAFFVDHKGEPMKL